MSRGWWGEGSVDAQVETGLGRGCQGRETGRRGRGVGEPGELARAPEGEEGDTDEAVGGGLGAAC